MPTIKPPGFTAATADALANQKFNVVPPSGAIVNMWISAAAGGATFGFTIGDRVIIVEGTEPNIEIAADVIDTSRDQVVFNEVVGPGQLQLPIGAAGTETQFMIHLRYL